MAMEYSVRSAFWQSKIYTLFMGFLFIASICFRSEGDTTSGNLFLVASMFGTCAALLAVYLFSNDGRAEEKMMLYGLMGLNALVAVLFWAADFKSAADSTDGGEKASNVFSGFYNSVLPIQNILIAFAFASGNVQSGSGHTGFDSSGGDYGTGV